MFRNSSRLLIALAALVVFGVPCRAAPALRAPGGGAVRALVVGIDAYQYLPRSAQLGGAVADATDIYQALTAAGIKPVTLTNGSAIRSRIVGEINRLVADSMSGDLVIITYAGHGMRVPAYAQWQGIDDSFSSQIALSGYGYSGNASHDVIVDKEMRAWLARFDAKGVDVLLVMDSCFGGGMRFAAMLSGTMAIRTISGDVERAGHDSFTGIPMTQKEARADIKTMTHVTFLAGATANSVVPEMTGFDSKNPKAPRGALSYFVARAIEGVATSGRDVSRGELFKFIPQNVRQATNERQRVDLEPRLADPAILEKLVFRLGDGAPGAPSVIAKPSGLPVDQAQADAQNQVVSNSDPVRVAVVHGTASSAASIKKGRAPYTVIEQVEGADLVWDVASGAALSRGDSIMEKVDGSNLGGVMDRTWAIRQTQRLSQPRVLPVRLREEGRTYAPGDDPQLVADELHGSYLTVVNIAADGTLQILFPTDGRDPHIRGDKWTFPPIVQAPFGADHVVAIAATRAPDDLVKWLIAHDGKQDAAFLPAMLAGIIQTDDTARIGTVGLYTTARH